MISRLSLIVFALLVVSMSIVVHSIPLKTAKEITLDNRQAALVLVKQPSAISKPSTSSTLEKPHPTLDQLLNEYLDHLSNEKKFDQVLHAQVKETPVQIHTNADEPADLNNPTVFTDINMNPSEWTHLQKQRRRRQINFNDEFRLRRKRALSSYDFYHHDPLHQPWLEHESFPRPTRDVDPIYWSPFLSERLSRSLLDSPEWNSIDDNPLDNGAFADSLLPSVDDQAEYEYNRYPVLFEPSNTAGNDWPMQEDYNIDDMPFPAEADGDEIVYVPDDDEPSENYFLS